MKNSVLCAWAFFLCSTLGQAGIASQPADVVNKSSVQVTWTTEPMDAPSSDKVMAAQFGVRDSASVARGGGKNLRFKSLSISIFGKPVAISGWMYLDLANPSDKPYVVYGSKDGISVSFRVGQDGIAWDVKYRLIPQSNGYRVAERQVCDAELKDDVCVVTHNSTWFFD